MTIVVFGDSLSEGTYSDNWVKKLGKTINHKIENYAVNGATSSVVRHKLGMMSFVDSLSCTGRPREVCVRSSGWSCE